MNSRKITGIILIVIGIIILGYALYAKSRVAEAKGNIDKGSSLFSNNSVNKQISGALERKVSAYDAPIMWGTIGGIILIIVGAGTLFLGRKR